MEPNDKFNLIVDGLQEVLGERELIEILQERNLRVYWGTATTGKPHIGYLKPLLKLCQLLQADCEVTILFADLHAFLDAMKSDWEQLEYRVQYYQEVITQTLMILGAPIENLKFVKGTDFQLSPEYTMDVYKLMSTLSLNDSMRAGTEVVKQSKNPRMASLLYPGLQALDEQYLDVDAQFGGIDQRKIFTLAEKCLPQIGYKKRIHLMNPMIPSFIDNTGKMSSSDPNSKIDLLDTPKKIRKKINKAFCEEGNLDCGLIKFVELVMFPILEMRGEFFEINREEQYGGPLVYTSYLEFQEDFTNNNLFPLDLKVGVIEWLVNLLEPIREHFNSMQDLINHAY